MRSHYRRSGIRLVLWRQAQHLDRDEIDNNATGISGHGSSPVQNIDAVVVGEYLAPRTGLLHHISEWPSAFGRSAQL